MKKNDLLNFLILILLYIGISAFPFNLFIKGNENIILICQCCAQVLYSVLAYLFVKKSTDFSFLKKEKKMSFLIFIPCFLACISNYLYLAFVPGDIDPVFSINIFPQAILFGLVAINEEMLFRVIFFNNSNFSNPLKSIIIGAAIFAFCHLTNFFSTFNPGELIVVCYTFLLGLMLGLIYLFTRSYALVATIHFGFNFFNKILFECLISKLTNIWMYLLSNAIVVAIVFVYLVILFVKNSSFLENKGE